MLHTANPVIKHKAGFINLAEELNNVSKPCSSMGVSRITFIVTANWSLKAVWMRRLIMKVAALLTLRTVPMRQLNRLLLITPSLSRRDTLGWLNELRKQGFLSPTWCPFCLITP